ncbi:MAG: hypothetical protein WKF73_22305 [Nocardioidaceae bacterium]
MGWSHGLRMQNVRDSLNAAEAKAQQVGAHMVMVGILPTLQTTTHAVSDIAVGQSEISAAQ